MVVIQTTYKLIAVLLTKNGVGDFLLGRDANLVYTSRYPSETGNLLARTLVKLLLPDLFQSCES